MDAPEKSDLVPADAQGQYDLAVRDITTLLETARRQAARSVNALMTATYWEIGRYIVEFEQAGSHRANYGEGLLSRLSHDLTARLGRGFGVDNLQRMRLFFSTYPPEEIYATLSRKSLTLASTTPREERLMALAQAFPLSWSHYVKLLSVENPNARAFYEAEALRGGWSLRQLDRQINSLFYERTALSTDKAAMLTKGAEAKPEDRVSIEAEIKDPFVLEFLNLKDEYSETELEEALVKHLESFLLELGNDFTFVARQKALRVGDTWFRMDLLLYHRRLRCLVIIDLKTGEFTHADAGQMNLYVNYAAEHLTLPDENPPVGLILCSRSNAAVAHYALNNMHNAILTAQYRLALPDEQMLAAEVERMRHALEAHRPAEADRQKPER